MSKKQAPKEKPTLEQLVARRKAALARAVQAAELPKVSPRVRLTRKQLKRAQRLQQLAKAAQPPAAPAAPAAEAGAPAAEAPAAKA